MKIALIDDEAPMRNNMRKLLTMYVPDAEIIFEGEGVASGLEGLGQQTPELLFLDVEMKDGTGFDLLSQYGEVDFEVIFVTGHDRYAIKAFKYSAVDYLLKPVDPMELQQALEKVKKRQQGSSNRSVSNLISNQQLGSMDQKVVLRDRDSIFVVQVGDIVRCEAVNNYTNFHLVDGRTLMITTTLKEYEKLFDELPFFRTHQSHLVNLHYVDRFDKSEGGIVYFKDGSSAPVSTRKKEQFVTRLTQF